MTIEESLARRNEAIRTLATGFKCFGEVTAKCAEQLRKDNARLHDSMNWWATLEALRGNGRPAFKKEILGG